MEKAMTDKATTDVVNLLAAEAEHVKQEIANADPQADLADLKCRLKAPKPLVGYAVVCPGWDPHARWIDVVDPWNLVPLPEARHSRDLSRSLGSSRQVIVKATITFEVVE